MAGRIIRRRAAVPLVLLVMAFALGTRLSGGSSNRNRRGSSSSSSSSSNAVGGVAGGGGHHGHHGHYVPSLARSHSNDAHRTATAFGGGDPGDPGVAGGAASIGAIAGSSASNDDGAHAEVEDREGVDGQSMGHHDAATLEQEDHEEDLPPTPQTPDVPSASPPPPPPKASSSSSKDTHNNNNNNDNGNKKPLVAGTAAMEVDHSTHAANDAAARAIANSGRLHNVRGHADNLHKDKIVFATFVSKATPPNISVTLAHFSVVGTGLQNLRDMPKRITGLTSTLFVGRVGWGSGDNKTPAHNGSG